MTETTRHQFCSVERDGALTVITLQRPEVMNALHAEADFELSAIWDAFAADDSQTVAIITGAGDRAFCAGNDLKLQASRGPRDRPSSGFGGLTTRFNMFKPVIAAVNGVAMGGGFELALACDLVIAAENASFALPEPKVGLAALLGGAQFLPRAIGMPRAMGILMTGRTVGAAEAMELGMLTALAPRGEALTVARTWAAQILACSPLSLQATKQMARLSAYDASFEESVRGARQLSAVARARAGADWVEGPRAFAEKRKPNWAR